MPAGFNNCVKNGGQVKTISGPNKKFGLKEGQYCYVCFDKKGMHRGHTKQKK